MTTNQIEQRDAEESTYGIGHQHDIIVFNDNSRSFEIGCTACNQVFDSVDAVDCECNPEDSGFRSGLLVRNWRVAV